MTDRSVFLTAARKYTADGLVIHPLAAPTDPGKSPGKRPLLKEWQKRGKATDEEIDPWFSNTDPKYQDCNIGLVCGEESNRTVLDFDMLNMIHVIFTHGVPETKMSERIPERAHIHFEYCAALEACKSGAFGVEVLNNGSNAVLPPSIHKEGQTYVWKNPDPPLAKLTDEQINIIKAIMKFPALVTRLRPCMQQMLKDREKHAWHDKPGRRRMLALATDLKRMGGTMTDAHILAALIYGSEYKPDDTVEEWNNSDPDKAWGCKRISGEFMEIPAQCRECAWIKDQKAGKGKHAGTTGRARPDIDLPPIPQEDIGDAPCKLSELLTVFHKWLHTEEDYNITAPACAFLANFVSGDPDIIGLIQPSGSNKTEILRSFGEKENQYIYPLSSVTEHSFISGHKDNIDTVQVLRKRIVIIKDLTTMLSRKEEVRSAIFADMRELTDGYMHKEFGNGIKKEYHDIHSSILFGSTNAIERYYSMYSNLGARMMFIRPHNDPQKARRQSTKNQDVLNEMRGELHATMIRFIKTALDDIRRVGLPELPEELIEHIGELCDLLAVARTTIHHNFKGIIDEIPEPEFPTRINNTVCRLTRIHALISGRSMGDKEDDAFALRIIADNIPTTRMVALRVLTEEWQTTPELSEASGAATESIRNILSELTTLGVVERKARESKEVGEDKRADSYRISSRWAPAIEELRGVIMGGEQCNEGKGKDETGINILSMNKKEYQKTLHIPLSTTNTTNISPPLKCHSSINQQAETEHPKTTHADLQKVIELAGREWEQNKGASINSTNLTEFLMWCCQVKGIAKLPSEIRVVAEKVFKLTPEPDKTKVLSLLCKDGRHTECYGETCSCDCHVK